MWFCLLLSSPVNVTHQRGLQRMAHFVPVTWHSTLSAAILGKERISPPSAPSYSTSSHLSLGCLTALTWLFGSMGGQAQEVQVLLTGAASPSQAPRRHHLHPSARSPCHAGTLYMAMGWAAFRWPEQAVQVTALTSQQDLPVQGFVAFSSPSGRTRSPARAL